jgi:hypothetical protein
MTMMQFKAYGASVSKILQTDTIYLASIGTSNAITVAMQPPRAAGTANTAAQQAAIATTVNTPLTRNLELV